MKKNTSQSEAMSLPDIKRVINNMASEARRVRSLKSEDKKTDSSKKIRKSEWVQILY